MQRQFRAPLDKVCIEIPAGLIDKGETPEEAAVRELREETGYVGVVSESSPVMFNGMLPLPTFEVFRQTLMFRSWFLYYKSEDVPRRCRYVETREPKPKAETRRW